MIDEVDYSQEELWQETIPGEEIPKPSIQERFSPFLRIHGDNIIECERALLLIAKSYQAQIRLVDSPPYLPRYEVYEVNSKLLYTVELLSGHKRWNFDLQALLQKYGAPLREATDAIVTEVSRDGSQEIVKCALEFCNALPAGNNAWQRNGRALACATVGIPYLYFADIGGVELDASRFIKAPRFPTPIVPFSYITAGKSFDTMCVPVYLPSPTSTSEIRRNFNDTFGEDEGEKFVRQIIEGTLPNDTYKRLMQKALLAIQKLAERRQNKSSTLQGNQWETLLSIKDGNDKAEWLSQNSANWHKRELAKVNVTDRFKALVERMRDAHFISIGAQDIPICLVHRETRPNFAATLSQVFGSYLTRDFIDWVASKDSSLIIVWITGFKPQGDDSRPDRGLVPMARMLFGNNIDLLSIVSGPGKLDSWNLLRDSPQTLANESGLWEPIINLSNGVLADSINAFPHGVVLKQVHRSFHDIISFPSTPTAPDFNFSEMDVDTTLHLLFARQETLGVFECMCNPPGGDWSGLSVFDNHSEQEYRWSSLPRVSGEGSKRPDHVIQFFSNNAKSIFLAIESKGEMSTLERNAGSGLKLYVQNLIQINPTISRRSREDWNLLTEASISMPDYSFLSGGAFRWIQTRAKQLEPVLDLILTRCRLDVVFAIEFSIANQSAILHIKTAPSAEFLLSKIHELSQRFGSRLKIQEH